jgi:hypothetical protein
MVRIKKFVDQIMDENHADTAAKSGIESATFGN